MSFVKDLNEGQEVEALFVEKLRGMFAEECLITRANGKFKDWDIKVDIGDGLEPITFEVKLDRMAMKTGNVAIELSCSGELSGILGSKASWIIYYINNEWWWCDREQLIHALGIDINGVPAESLIVNKEKCRVVLGGDGGRARILLLPLTLFKQIFHKQD